MTELEENAVIHTKFQELLAAATRGDEEQVKKLVEAAKTKCLVMSIDSEVVDVSWEDTDPLVVVECVFKFGDVPVAGRQEEWSGYWGCGGTGWWTEMFNSNDSNWPDGLDELIEMTGLESEQLVPDVPRSSEEVEAYWDED